MASLEDQIKTIVLSRIQNAGYEGNTITKDEMIQALVQNGESQTFAKEISDLWRSHHESIPTETAQQIAQSTVDKLSEEEKEEVQEVQDLLQKMVAITGEIPASHSLPIRMILRRSAPRMTLEECAQWALANMQQKPRPKPKQYMVRFI